MYHFVGLVLLLASMLVTVAGCSGAKIEPPKLPPPKVTVITPVRYPVRDYWHYNGYLDTTESVEVRSKIRGFIAKVEFKEGTEVQEGDLLYRIERVEYETARNKAKAERDRAEADIKNLEAQIKLAKADRDRYAEAVQRGVEARPELDRAQATYDVRVAEHLAAIATRDAAEAALKTAEIQLNYTDIRAKISGRISRTLVSKGNLIQADTTLLTTIVRVDELFVYFDAPESDLISYQRTQISRLPLRAGVLLARMLMGQGFSVVGSIPVEVGLPGEEGYPHIGYIDFRENRIETSTGTIRIRGRIDNPPVNGIRLLFPGMYARIRVPKGDPLPQLTLPEDCLMTGQEGRFVYVLGSNNKVEKRLVTVGATVWRAPPPTTGVSVPSWVAVNPQPQPPPEGQPPKPTRRPIKSVVAITSGLQPADRVLLDGLQRARPGDAVDPESWSVIPPEGQ